MNRRDIPHRSEFLTRDAWLLACAEFRHRQMILARRWFVFRVTLCCCAIPVCLLYLYACAYLPL